MSSEATTGQIPDVYGQLHPYETLDLMTRKIKEFHNELNKLPIDVKHNAIQAFEKCNSNTSWFNKDDTFIRMFLRCEVYNADLAAVRYAHYWDKRLELFGPIRAYQPLTIDTMNTDDMIAIKIGFINVIERNTNSNDEKNDNDNTKNNDKNSKNDNNINNNDETSNTECSSSVSEEEDGNEDIRSVSSDVSNSKEKQEGDNDDVSGTCTDHRTILYVDPSKQDPTKYTRQSMMRAIWYMVHTVLEDDVNVQKKGLICLAYPNNNNNRTTTNATTATATTSTALKHGIDKGLIQQILGSVRGCLPVRISAIHICHPRSIFRMIIWPIIATFMNQRLRQRVLIHTGTNEYVVNNILLHKYQINKQYIPIELGGTYDTTTTTTTNHTNNNSNSSNNSNNRLWIEKQKKRQVTTLTTGTTTTTEPTTTTAAAMSVATNTGSTSTSIIASV